MGRGVLADGQRAHRHRGPPLRGARRARRRRWREWAVAGRTEETADCATFRLRPADGAPAPDFQPGQYVSVQVELADGARQIRQYSLTSAPGGELRSDHRQARARADASPAARFPATSTPGVREGDGLRVSGPRYGDLVLDRRPRRDGLRCCWPPPGSAARRWCRCWSSWRPKGTAPRCRGARRPRPRRARRCATTRAAGRQAREQPAAHYWYENPAPATPPAARAWSDLTDVGCRPGPRLPLRAAALHAAVRTQLLAKGVAARRHPLRGLRPRPVAGRLISPLIRVTAAPSRSTATAVRWERHSRLRP